jgi:cob(I)alamin adenosyltransferase
MKIVTIFAKIKIMKIYTKTGDTGMTSLFGGARLPKDHIRIESYGTIDELNSNIGVIADSIDNQLVISELHYIQDRLFTVGSHLASDPSKEMIVPDIFESDIELLEKSMDNMNEVLPELRHFILPGGHISVSFCHVTRCVCRRAERLVVTLNHNETVEPIILIYLNRLSDYFFVLGRYLAHIQGVEEKKWNPRKK